MTSCRQIAIDNGVNRRTVWLWCKKLGIKPNYQIKPNGGFWAILDDDQEKQLKEWLAIRDKMSRSEGEL